MNVTKKNIHFQMQRKYKKMSPSGGKKCIKNKMNLYFLSPFVSAVAELLQDLHGYLEPRDEYCCIKFQQQKHATISLFSLLIESK